MEIALVDAENFQKINTIKDGSKVVIFYSDKTLNILKENDKFSDIQMVKCQNGQKNAMDFQIAFYLGCICNKTDTYTIYSDDHGYDSMISYAQSNGIKVKRYNTSFTLDGSKDNILKELIKYKTVDQSKLTQEEKIKLYQAELKYYCQYTGKKQKQEYQVCQSRAVKCLSSIIGYALNKNVKEVSKVLRNQNSLKREKLIADFTKKFGTESKGYIEEYYPVIKKVLE